MARKKEAEAQAPSFEVSMQRLEEIVRHLEAGDLPLEESLARFQEGMGLARLVGRMLDEAERRIDRLVEGAGGAPEVEPLGLGLELEGA